MEVRVYKGGNSDRNNPSGYGFGISVKDRDVFFKKEWDSVSIKLGGEKEIIVKITPSLWNRCHELRSREIGTWLIKNGFTEWPKGKPHKFTMIQIEDNKFKIL